MRAFALASALAAVGLLGACASNNDAYADAPPPPPPPPAAPAPDYAAVPPAPPPPPYQPAPAATELPADTSVRAGERG
jgi:hypothetical protein